jgi:hypothetical protein
MLFEILSIRKGLHTQYELIDTTDLLDISVRTRLVKWKKLINDAICFTSSLLQRAIIDMQRGVNRLEEIMVAESATIAARNRLLARKESINRMDNLEEHPESRSQFSLIPIRVEDGKHPIAPCRVNICPIDATVIPPWAAYGWSLCEIGINRILGIAADPMEAY